MEKNRGVNLTQNIFLNEDSYSSKNISIVLVLKTKWVFVVVVVDFRQNVFYNLKIALNIGVLYAMKEKHKNAKRAKYPGNWADYESYSGPNEGLLSVFKSSRPQFPSLLSLDLRNI